MMIPNTVVLSATVMPLRSRALSTVKVTLSSGISLTHVQAILDSNISVDDHPAVRRASSLEAIDGRSVVVRVKAISGAKLRRRAPWPTR